MSREIHVLMVMTNLAYNDGVSTFAMNYYTHMNHDEIHMDFVVHDTPEEKYVNLIKANGDSVYTFPSLSLKNMFKLKRKAVSLMKEKHYDIVHCNLPNVAFLYLGAAKKAKAAAAAEKKREAAREKAFKAEIKAEKSNSAKIQAQLITEYSTGEKLYSEYMDARHKATIDGLEKILAVYVKYGKNTGEIEKQIAEERQAEEEDHQRNSIKNLERDKAKKQAEARLDYYNPSKTTIQITINEEPEPEPEPQPEPVNPVTEKSVPVIPAAGNPIALVVIALLTLVSTVSLGRKK